MSFPSWETRAWLGLPTEDFKPEILSVRGCGELAIKQVDFFQLPMPFVCSGTNIQNKMPQGSSISLCHERRNLAWLQQVRVDKQIRRNMELQNQKVYCLLCVNLH